MASEIKVDTIVNAGGDNDSGIDLSTNDVVAVKTANTERMRVDASGGVAIGATSVSSGFKTELNHSGETYGLKLTNGSSSVRFGAGGPEISATGARLDIRTTDSNEMRFYTNNSERMRLDSSARLFFGTAGAEPSSSQVGARISGTNGDNFWKSSTGSSTSGYDQLLFLNGNGIVGSVSTSGSATSYNTSSDYRLKENVVTDYDATTRLKQLKPSRFNFKADKDTTVDGFLAHEVSSIVPEAVRGEKDAVDADGNPKYQGIDQGKLVPLLTKALQEAIAKIETLEAKVTALESK